MQLADLPAVMSIERRAFTLAWTSGLYRRELTANPWSHYLVVRSTLPTLPPVLAYGGVWQMEQAAHIPTFATHPDFQGRQLGAFLLVHLLLLAHSLNCTEATLEVRISNQRARDLYARFGFEIAGDRRRYYLDNNEDALIMTRPTLNLADLQSELAAVEYHLQSVWAAERGSAYVSPMPVAES